MNASPATLRIGNTHAYAYQNAISRWKVICGNSLRIPGFAIAMSFLAKDLTGDSEF